MDLAGIQNRLRALGVTLRFADDPPANANLLCTQREYRAALYVDRLEAVRTYLTTTLAQPAPVGLGAADYPFVRAALASGALLNQLASSLDAWVCMPVEAAVNAAIAAGGPGAPTDYQTWFTARILDPVNATYLANVAAFFNQYPITDHALTQITANFQNNIATALRRVLADRAAITLLFSDRYPWLTLTGLSEITSTGSDFHKGGQQVLILTFTTRYWPGWVPNFSTLKLVYKPADVEIDCLVAGESAAVNRATGAPGFLAESLVEIFNSYVAAHPAPGLEALPVYRILPRNPVSQAGGPPYPVRQAYGYLEYLSYAFTGQTWGAFNYYPFGASDYVIFQRTPEAPIIERFYHQAGQFLALALAFSLVDLHLENVRATTYQPHLIDLEASLTADVASVFNTSLLDHPNPNNTGGFNADSRSNDEFVYRFAVNPNNPQRWDLHQDFIQKWYANRLWVFRPDKRIVLVNGFWLLQGLVNGLGVIRAVQLLGGFAAWLGRANNVLVRILPVATGDWAAVRSQIYEYAPARGAPPAPAVALGPTVTDAQLHTVTGLYGQAPAAEPKYVAAAAAQVGVDLTNFDIPVFYHRVGSLELLDSMGAVIPVPAQVTVYNNAAPPAPVQVNTNLARQTYFGAVPTTARVVARLNLIAGGGFGGLLANYQAQTLIALGHAAAPNAPGVLF